MEEKKNIFRFTPEQLGLERIVVNGKRYIDVTPLWIDSKKSVEVYKRAAELIEEEKMKNRRRERS